MRGPAGRTKVVLRHLPPSISQSSLVEQVDYRFAGRYNWLSFRPGKNSQKNLRHSRAYIDFKQPNDVIEFAEFFDGHVFVNEKGTQFKTVVEYAPSQRVPKQGSKKDGREGTILKDPEYLEFLEFLSKPVENLPSAEIQLERKEVERAGAGKEAPVITPLMDYVRQKRAAKSGMRRSVSNGRSTKKVTGLSTGSSGASLSKRGTEKRKVSAAMYVPRGAAKGGTGKDNTMYILVSKRDLQLSDKAVSSAPATSTDALDEESGGSGTIDSGKKILLLKGKEKEIPHVSGASSAHQNVASHAKSSPISTVVKQNQRREASGRIIRSILLNRGRSQNLSVVESEHYQTANPDKRTPRPPRVQLLQKDANGTLEDQAPNELNTGYSEKQDRRMRNKDRPDRVVWAPLRRSDGSHASEESLSLSASQSALDSAEATHVEKGHGIQSTNAESKSGGNGVGGHSPVNNGSYKHGGRRGSAHIKDPDGYTVAEGKPPRRGSSGYGSHEKRVWVQKSSTGS